MAVVGHWGALLYPTYLSPDAHIVHSSIVVSINFISFMQLLWNKIFHLVRVNYMCPRGSPEESPLRMGQRQPWTQENVKRLLAYNDVREMDQNNV